MFNATKTLTALAALALTVSACTKDTTHTDRAIELLTEAQSLREAKDYAGAVALLDSLDVAYRDCLEQRREGTRLRIETLIDLAVDSIEADEQIRPRLQAAIDSMAPLFLKVSLQGTEGFSVLRSTYTGREMDGTCVQPRIDEKGYFYVIVNNRGRRLRLNSVSYGGATATGESVSLEGSELMNLRQEDVASLSGAIAAASSGPITLTLGGTSGNVTVKLSKAQADAWRTTWQYANLLQLRELRNYRREKYETQLATLNEQLRGMESE